ncbi:hypothetical protein DL95DRAFT_382013, partial [Leptodontidium sp. 2 PMI_412]
MFTIQRKTHNARQSVIFHPLRHYEVSQVPKESMIPFFHHNPMPSPVRPPLTPPAHFPTQCCEHDVPAGLEPHIASRNRAQSQGRKESKSGTTIQARTNESIALAKKDGC